MPKQSRKEEPPIELRDLAQMVGVAFAASGIEQKEGSYAAFGTWDRYVTFFPYTDEPYDIAVFGALCAAICEIVTAVPGKAHSHLDDMERLFLLGRTYALFPRTLYGHEKDQRRAFVYFLQVLTLEQRQALVAWYRAVVRECQVGVWSQWDGDGVAEKLELLDWMETQATTLPFVPLVQRTRLSPFKMEP